MIRFSRTVSLLVFYGLSTAVISLSSLFVSIWSLRLGRVGTRLWARANLRAWGVKVRVEGLDNLPAGGTGRGEGLMIVANHQSAADILAVSASLPLDICWVSKASLGGIPFLGWHLKRLHLLVERGRPGGAKRFLRAGKERLADGASVAIFPEGTWSEDNEALLPFQKGAFLLARSTGRPVVPLAICGSRDVLPPGGLTPRKGTIILRVGTPLHPGNFPGRSLDAMADETFRSITLLHRPDTREEAPASS